jgi:hypothetical protein
METDLSRILLLSFYNRRTAEYRMMNVEVRYQFEIEHSTFCISFPFS